MFGRADEEEQEAQVWKWVTQVDMAELKRMVRKKPNKPAASRKEGASDRDWGIASICPRAITHISASRARDNNVAGCKN